MLKSKQNRLLMISTIIGIVIIYLIPFKSGFLYEIHELLHFNFDDNFGTYRIFLWKRTIPLIKDYPIFGSGPDTFALRFMPLYTEDIAAIGPLTINDTAANIYLTMLVNLGIVGTISYLLFLGSQLIIGIKKMNKYSCAISRKLYFTLFVFQYPVALQLCCSLMISSFRVKPAS